MKTHSNTAWDIASKYSHVLASETRDLALHIDVALARLWQGMDTAPLDRFVLLYCPEDKSRWLAKWQGDQWYGVDEMGLTRSCGYHQGSGRVTGWEIAAWMPLPDPPYTD